MVSSGRETHTPVRASVFLGECPSSCGFFIWNWWGLMAPSPHVQEPIKGVLMVEAFFKKYSPGWC